MRKLKFALVGCLLLLIGSVFVTAQTEKERILQRCEASFGRSLDPRLDLFEVNPLFVFQPMFDDKDRLIKISVTPKYIFEESHPAWKEPKEDCVLSKAEYELLFSRIGSIRPLGLLEGRHFDPAITNSTSHQTEYYQNADLTYLERFYFDRWTDKERVWNVDVDFRHEVNGRVTGKKHSEIFRYRPFLMCISEQCYYVDRSTFTRIKVGSASTFEGISAPEYVNLETFGRKIKPPKWKPPKDKS